ncbi:DUF3429 domain-containing protein [Methylorubrum suomiense]|uniref:DUF3429 domain-containing protein n=1 Tax=Methylorubrum suomiense TaxID=144191 RepID=A0ABQ4URL2_9HYPH|nr:MULTISPECIES: DUF3429 domain-containing protein [Methylobacteriaceae]GJE74033.1 hypothetical protein BGCPKDLD_0600 [Methylorubrum suomiense]
MNRPLTDRRDGRTIHAYEPRAVPWLSVVFGYGPMLPFLAGGALVWLLRGEAGAAIFTLTLLWGCAILLFLSGVRRGVSFRTEGGARVSQIVTMLGLFLLGFSALVAFALGFVVAALGLLIVGYVAIAVLDPIAARRGEAPLFFERLRPFQMPLAVLGLAALLAHRLLA